MASLEALLDLLETAAGPADPLPSTDGWELVLAENVAYLVDDDRRREALRELRRLVGIEPEQILAASDDVLLQVVAGMQPTARVARLRRCAELAIAEAPWTRFPGIGKWPQVPGDAPQGLLPPRVSTAARLRCPGSGTEPADGQGR